MTDMQGHVFGERQMIDVPLTAAYPKKRGFLMLLDDEASSLRDSNLSAAHGQCDRAVAAGPLIVQLNLSLENKKAAHGCFFV